MVERVAKIAGGIFSDGADLAGKLRGEPDFVDLVSRLSIYADDLGVRLSFKERRLPCSDVFDLIARMPNERFGAFE